MAVTARRWCQGLGVALPGLLLFAGWRWLVGWPATVFGLLGAGYVLALVFAGLRLQGGDWLAAGDDSDDDSDDGAGAEDDAIDDAAR